jgi:NADH-quinone oxidoreductase subunit G
VLRHFEAEVIAFDSVVESMEQGKVTSAYLVGGYPTGWIDDRAAAALARVAPLVVQDILPSPATAAADFVLPGGSFAEREGTFVNHAGLAQAIEWSIRPKHQAWPDGRILFELAGRSGLYHPPSVRREMAATINYFAPLAAETLDERGVLLEEKTA